MKTIHLKLSRMNQAETAAWNKGGYCMNFWKLYSGRLIFTSLGLIFAILILTIGFGRTFFILVCCGTGYLAGMFKDKILYIPERLKFWKNR